MGRDTEAAEGERAHHAGRRRGRRVGAGGRHGLEAFGRVQGAAEQKTRKPGGGRRKRRPTEAQELRGTPQGGTRWCQTPSPRRRGRPPPWGWSGARGGSKEAVGAIGCPRTWNGENSSWNDGTARPSRWTQGGRPWFDDEQSQGLSTGASRGQK